MSAGVRPAVPLGKVRHAIKVPVREVDSWRVIVTGTEDVEVEAVVDPYELLMAYGQRLADAPDGVLRVAGDGLVLRVVRRELLSGTR